MKQFQWVWNYIWFGEPTGLTKRAAWSTPFVTVKGRKNPGWGCSICEQNVWRAQSFIYRLKVVSCYYKNRDHLYITRSCLSAWTEAPLWIFMLRCTAPRSMSWVVLQCCRKWFNDVQCSHASLLDLGACAVIGFWKRSIQELGKHV